MYREALHPGGQANITQKGGNETRIIYVLIIKYLNGIVPKTEPGTWGRWWTEEEGGKEVERSVQKKTKCSAL